MVNDSISCANGAFGLRLDFRKRRLRHQCLPAVSSKHSAKRGGKTVRN